LERATTLYPNQPDLVKAKVAALADAKNGWKLRGASICPDQLPQSNAPEFAWLADENLKRYKKHLRSELGMRSLTITGELWLCTHWQSLRSLLCGSDNLNATRGESAVGESVAKRAVNSWKWYKTKLLWIM